MRCKENRNNGRNCGRIQIALLSASRNFWFCYVMVRLKIGGSPRSIISPMSQSHHYVTKRSGVLTVHAWNFLRSQAMALSKIFWNRTWTRDNPGGSYSSWSLDSESKISTTFCTTRVLSFKIEMMIWKVCHKFFD